MTIKYENQESNIEKGAGPKIVVIGVGGAGGNAVNNMIRSNLEGVVFVIANTDSQALRQSLVPEDQRIQLGLTITQGLGAGSKPDVGKAAAEESSEEVLKFIQGANMVFITAGMGGGTGTGAAPVIARIAREAGILTVGVVTKPFSFEGSHRAKSAEKGIEDLQQYVDTLLIIPNQNLFRLATENTTFADAFKMADEVLYSGVRGVTDLMIMPGLINLDFADIRSIMSEMGKAMMGTGESEGERRALDAAEAAISNPLLDDVSLQGARGVLINITGGYDITLYEVDEAANRIRDDVDSEAIIIFGSTFDERLNGKVRVSVVATGIGGAQDSIFKNRDISGVMGLNKRDSNAKMFEQVSMKNIEQKEEQKYSDNIIDLPGNDDLIQPQVSEYIEKPKRKAGSFFDMFTSRHKRDSIKTEEDYSSLEVRKNVFKERKDELSESELQDDLEIPSCFRKKK
ncbi:MAG: cell division protein FtsZ [Holosporales bacterium]|jgi:cell division protein FtsZ|nr:cell division protein FtsZ [Holosporales bacterium]